MRGNKMNHLENGTVAVGAPGSKMRERAELEDQALGIIRKAYREQPNLVTLAMSEDRNCIGAWSESLGTFVMVAAKTITGPWVSCEYELLVNGKRLEHNWQAFPREAVSHV
jgi:hypothetical protein